MGLVGLNRTFVYGDFVTSGKKQRIAPLIMQPFAIEILREFSTTEFVGKLFARVGSSWLPSTRGGIANYQWYEAYQRSKAPLYFEMEGSGIWQVQNLREESDDSGPYMAVALKFATPKG